METFLIVLLVFDLLGEVAEDTPVDDGNVDKRRMKKPPAIDDWPFEYQYCFAR